MRPTRKRLRFAALTAAALTLAPGLATAGPESSTGLGLPFDARALIAAADADTVAQAYIDDDIGPALGRPDTLTVLRPGAAPPLAKREVAVSNSVWGPPTTIDVTPDGRHAIVLEVKKQRDGDDRSFERDLSFTTRISVVDIGAHPPRLVQVTDTGGFAAHSLSVSPRGDHVAVANWAAPGELTGIPAGQGRQISIMPLRDGRLGAPRLFGMNDIGGDNVFPNTIAWHPSGGFLAVTVGLRNLVAFYRVTGSAERLEVRPWGQPVEAGQFPLSGRWTPDGRFFVASTMEWNEPAVSDRNSPPGSLSLVRFDAEPADGVHHGLVRGAKVGINPEGVAVSPDGRHVVTVNLRYSHLPGSFDPMRPPTTSSMSLVRLDPQTGETRTVGEYTFDGILPEGVAFDRTGRHLAVAVFDFNGAKGGRGAVQFWRLHRGDDPRLEQLPAEVPTVRGTHSLAVVP